MQQDEYTVHFVDDPSLSIICFSSIYGCNSSWVHVHIAGGNEAKWNTYESLDNIQMCNMKYSAMTNWYITNIE